MEAEAFAGLAGQARKMRAGGLEQAVGAHEVRLDKVAGRVDRAIDVALGREVHDDVGPKRGEGLAQGGSVADVGLDEGETRAGRYGLKRRQVPGIGELVQNADVCPTQGDELARDGGAYEAGAAGKEDVHVDSRSPALNHARAFSRKRAQKPCAALGSGEGGIRDTHPAIDFRARLTRRKRR